MKKLSMRNLFKKKNREEQSELTEIEIYNNAICKKGLKVYIIGIMITVLLTTIFKFNFTVSYISNIVIVVIFMVVMFKIKGDDDTIKNGRLVTYAGITNKIFAYSLTMETYFSEHSFPVSYLIGATLMINVVYYLAVRYQIKKFMKNPTSEKIRRSTIGLFLLSYLISVISLNSFWLMIIIVPIMIAYSLYEDVRLITISGICANVIAVLASLTQVQYYDTNAYAGIGDIPILIGNLLSGSLSDRTLHMFWIYMLILAFFGLYTIVMVKVTSTVKKFNKDKIDVIENEKNKMQVIIEKIMEIGIKIKNNAFYTQKFIDELHRTTVNSAEVLDDVINDNISNINSIEEQTDMTVNITKLIDDVVYEVENAKNTTRTTLEELDKSKRSFDMLKSKSNEISKNNEQIIEVMDEFVGEAREVKNITKGIEYLLDETNLLSFNTYIKSAKDKEVGKGFAVIAGEIYALAKETYALTENINNMVNKLENSALVTNDVINEIVKELNDEGKTIDETIKEFNYMERDIYALGDNVNEIYIRVNNVTESNEEIVNHISHIRKVSAEVTAATQQAGAINEEDKVKIKETNTIMNDMIERAEKLEEYYYMQQN